MASSAASIAVKLQKLSNQATEKSFKYNTAEANTARSWQKMMSDTSHQREVADLKKAGLNPVLASNQGAQSYTTSSANDHAENASNAVASVYGSEMSAEATKKAAAMSAQAMKAAAAQQAAAARYAASLQYSASIYHSDRAKEASDYRANKDYDAKKYAIDNQLASNPIQLIDKFTRNSGIQNAALNGRIFKGALKTVGLISNGKFSNLAQNMSYNIKNGYPALKADGKRAINSVINKIGIQNTASNRNLVLRAVLVRRPSDILNLYRVMNNSRKTTVKKKPSSSSTAVNRTFHAEGSHGRMVMSDWF